MYSFEATPYMIPINVLTVYGVGEGFVCIECYVQQDAVHRRLQRPFQSPLLSTRIRDQGSHIIPGVSHVRICCRTLLFSNRHQPPRYAKRERQKNTAPIDRGDFHPMDLA